MSYRYGSRVQDYKVKIWPPRRRAIAKTIAPTTIDFRCFQSHLALGLHLGRMHDKLLSAKIECL